MTKKSLGAAAKRHRVNYRGDYLYVTVVPEKKEVFVSSANQDQDPLTGAAIDALTRTVSLLWRHSSIELVVEQLKKSSRIKRDLPGILVQLLEKELQQ